MINILFRQLESESSWKSIGMMIHNNHTYILQRYLVWAVVVTPFTEIAPVD